MKTMLLAILLFVSIVSISQKTVTCKKGDVKANGQVVAIYDGVGSMFKEVKLGIFAPGTKDTLISVNEVTYNPKNPLFPTTEVVYKLSFKNTALTPFYVCDTGRKGVRFMERDVMEMIFNDNVPLLITASKLDESAVEKFRSTNAYDLEKIVAFVKGVEDTIAIINKSIVERDVTKPVSFKLVSDKSNQFETNQTFEILQAGILLGRMQKFVSTGNFPKASYTFWKSITPVVVDGIDLKYSPVAICSSGATAFDIPIISVVGKNEYKIKGSFNQLETAIANVLVSNKLL